MRKNNNNVPSFPFSREREREAYGASGGGGGRRGVRRGGGGSTRYAAFQRNNSLSQIELCEENIVTVGEREAGEHRANMFVEITVNRSRERERWSERQR